MADDWTTAEIVRRLDEVLRTVQGLVSRPEYSADQRHWEHRFTDLERDLVDEREARKAADADERKAREEAVKELKDINRQRGTNRRQNVFQGLVPSLLVLASIAVSVLLAFWGK